jgi:Sec-independent protein secretion pathway component TatC
MFWRYVALVFFILAFVCLPVWPYSQTWTFYPMGFCFFLTALALLASVFARRGSSIWRSGGQRPPRG